MKTRISPPETIVVRCPNWVGDLIMATPVFECLRINFPSSRIVALTRPYNIRILEDHPCIDVILPCEDKTLGGIWKTSKTVRKYRADFAILLPNSLRSYAVVRLAGINKIFGYRRGERKYFIQGPAPVKDSKGYKPVPMVDYYLGICKWLGLELPENKKPSLRISEELQIQGDALLRKYGIYDNDLVIGFNPGAKFGSSKCWPPEYFSQLADLLVKEMPCKILMLVGPGEDQIASEIVSKSKTSIINTAEGKIDLGLLKPFIKRCNLLITNDTGPRQYATAMDIPMVVLMGPTDPRYTEKNLEKSIILRHDLPCVPCHKKICPSDHQCMKDIKPEDVVRATKKLLEAG